MTCTSSRVLLRSNPTCNMRTGPPSATPAGSHRKRDPGGGPRLHGIQFIKPHCPWQNGKVERLNRTLVTEWAYRQVFTSNDERAAALAPWIEHYNTRRRHSALGGLSPISRLSPT